MSLRSTINHTAATAAEWLGINSILRRRARDRLLVLCYHGVVEQVPPGEDYLYRNWVPAELFDQQMRYLATRFAPIAAAEVADAFRAGRRLPDRAVCVSFDDGYRNNLTVAAPILAAHSIPAMVAVTTDRIEKQDLLWPTEVDLRVMQWPNSTFVDPAGESVPMPADRAARTILATKVRSACKRLDDNARRAYVESLRNGTSLEIVAERDGFLSWDEVRALRDRGIEIASHTVSHPILSRTDDARLRAEVVDSKQRIEAELELPCRCFVYPNGGRDDVSDRTRRALDDAGYELAFTLCGARNPTQPDPLAIDRTAAPTHAPLAVWAGHISGLRGALRG